MDMVSIVDAFLCSGDGKYAVSFPDIEGADTCGNNLDIAITMADDALATMMTSYEDEGKGVPDLLFLYCKLILSFYYDRQHGKIFITRIFNAVPGSLRADMDYSRLKYFFLSITDGSSLSRDDVIHVIAGVLSVISNTPARMDSGRDDPAFVVIKHPDGHLSCPAVHARHCQFLKHIKIY